VRKESIHIDLTDNERTPMKRYDLMNGINARGTYLRTEACRALRRRSIANRGIEPS
jgi:citronellol/citronellal dehydrogenase